VTDLFQRSRPKRHEPCHHPHTAAIFFGGRAYLAGWIRSPGKNLLILPATLAVLALWMLWRWWQYR